MITLEQPSDYYVNLKYEPSKLFRAQSVQGGKRIYYNPETFDFFISATSFTSMCIPKEKTFLKWYRTHDNPELYVDQKAEYGTIYHICCGMLIKDGKVTDEQIEEMVKKVCEEKKWNLEKAWIHGNGDYTGLRKAIRGFAKFLFEYKVKPIAIEIGLSHPMGVATFIDFVGELTIEEKGFWGEVYKSGEKKGQPKESKKEKVVRALINFKSGKNIYPEHILQLSIEKDIWNHNFPDLKIDEVYNLSPVDYEREPTYKLTYQTDKIMLPKWQYYLGLIPFFKDELIGRAIPFDESSEVEAGKDPQAFKFMSYRDAIIKQHQINYPIEKII